MSVVRQLHKFGGSSLADPECYRRVANILKEYSSENDLVVVSAAGKTTNRLIEFLDGLERDGRLAHDALQSLRHYQFGLVESLLSGEAQGQLLAQLNDEFSTLAELAAPLSQTQRAAVLGHGEVWSARLLAALLNQTNLPAVAQDARAFLRAESGTQPEVDRARFLSAAERGAGAARQAPSDHHRFYGAKWRRRYRAAWSQWFRLLGDHHWRVGRSVTRDDLE